MTIFQLKVVDHPAGTEIFTDERFVVPAVKPRIIVTDEPHKIERAVDDLGNDVTTSSGTRMATTSIPLGAVNTRESRDTTMLTSTWARIFPRKGRCISSPRAGSIHRIRQSMSRLARAATNRRGL